MKIILMLFTMGFAALLLIGIWLLINKFVRFINKKYGCGNLSNTVIGGISFLLVAISPLLVPMRPESQGHISILNLGFPVPYIKQYITNELSGEILTQKATIINPWYHSIDFNLISFVFSVLIAYAALLIAFYFMILIRSNFRRQLSGSPKPKQYKAIQ